MTSVDGGGARPIPTRVSDPSCALRRKAFVRIRGGTRGGPWDPHIRIWDHPTLRLVYFWRERERKNGSLHIYTTHPCAFGRVFHLRGERSVRKVQFQEFPQTRTNASGVRVQVRARPVHGREVERDGGVHRGVPAAVSAAAGQRGLLQPQLQLRASGRRAQVRRVPRAACVWERDEESAVPEAL